jgi:putative endonuclease
MGQKWGQKMGTGTISAERGARSKVFGNEVPDDALVGNSACPHFLMSPVSLTGGPARPSVAIVATSEDPRHRRGRDGEDAAADLLRRKGFEIISRNVRTAFGEIDLVALDGDTVVFVEVKARRGANGLEAVDARKQFRLSRLALAYLARAGWTLRPARFDVVAVDSNGACTHVVNAFDCASGS